MLLNNLMGVVETMRYTFWVSVLLILLVTALVWAGKGQDGTVSTIIGAISGYWLGQGNNGKPN